MTTSKPIRTIHYPYGPGGSDLPVDVFAPTPCETDEIFRATNIQQGRGYLGQASQPQAPTQPIQVDTTDLDSPVQDFWKR